MGWVDYTPSRLPFAADVHSLIRNAGRQIDWSLIPTSWKSTAASYQIVASGVSAQGAVALTVDATPVALPNGTILYFGASQELALLTAYAPAGSTSLTVQALPQAIEDNDEATFVVEGDGEKVIPAGKIMAQLASGLLIPRELVTGSETSTCILETDAVENEEFAGNTGYGCLVGGVIYANLLPDAAHANIATWKGELNAAGVGLFIWETYADSRAS